tara:strand:- start:370 stop:558 length:189 start_codon:yes stop_codon:yes gene_type:complete
MALAAELRENAEDSDQQRLAEALMAKVDGQTCQELLEEIACAPLDLTPEDLDMLEIADKEDE